MNKRHAHIIAYHGWGLTDSFWKKWNELLSNNIQFEAVSRGYTGKRIYADFNEDVTVKKIVFVHSFGLHWCPQHILSQTDHLVIFGGFLDFHPDSDTERKRSRFIVQQMLSRFVEKPDEVLKKFLKNTFWPDEPDEQLLNVDIDHEKLLEDLSAIQNEVQPQQILHEIPEISIVHGEDDKIVSNEKARSLYQSLRYRSQYFEIKQAGHALPYTHAKECYSLLKPIIEPEYFLNQ
ncbi:MAG: alpha/beta fold hydrolase [Balneolaceae bacterium]